MVLLVGLWRMTDDGDPDVTGSPKTKLESLGVETGIGAAPACGVVRVADSASITKINNTFYRQDTSTHLAAHPSLPPSLA
jgi:hypothetical protein